MSGFRIFAHGCDFDAGSFLATTALAFDGWWHKGEYGNDCPASNGVFKILGDGKKLNLPEQDRLAVEFLLNNRKELESLARYPGVTTFILGLQYEVELLGDCLGLCVDFSPLLMKHCLEIGLVPACYINVERQRAQGTLE